MNGDNPNQTVTTYTQNIVYDEAGNPILHIGTRVYTVMAADGRTTTYKISENIQLADGHVWNGAQGAAGLFLAVCEDCRHPRVSLLPFRVETPSNGLCLASGIKKCVRGKSVCWKHRVLDDDGRYRCRTCHWWHVVHRAIHHIFWEPQ